MARISIPATEKKRITMEIYNKLKTPPKTALKTIRGGRIGGMTDINPQWRYEAMTEVFGPCGIGWTYEIERTWTETHGEEVAAFVQIKLYIKHDGEWSRGIPGTGGSMFAVQEKKGIHVSDECYKMATTDALSVAMKLIGVGGDIYAGRFDRSKYRDEEKPVKKPKPKNPKPLTDKQLHEYSMPTKEEPDRKLRHIPAETLSNILDWLNENDGSQEKISYIERYLAKYHSIHNKDVAPLFNENGEPV